MSKNDEALIQIQIVKWLQDNGYFFFSVPNEGHGGRGAKAMLRAMRLKAMGLRAGVADLVVVLPNGMVCFLEVKAAKGRQSDTQIGFERRVKELGHRYYLVRSVDGVQKILES